MGLVIEVCEQVNIYFYIFLWKQRQLHFFSENNIIAILNNIQLIFSFYHLQNHINNKTLDIKKM